MVTLTREKRAVASSPLTGKCVGTDTMSRRHRRSAVRSRPRHFVVITVATAVAVSAGLALGSRGPLDLIPIAAGPATPSGAPASGVTPVTSAPRVSHSPTEPQTAMPRPDIFVDGHRQPRVVVVPYSASGRYVVVPGTARPPESRRGTVIRYLVEVERGLPFSATEFAADVHRTLNDARGWGHGGRMRFERVDHGPVRFRVSLTSPALANEKCLPLQVEGELSCWQGGRAVVNAERWGHGAATYGRDVASYRRYLINHEVGHALGHGHRSCPGEDRRAPVMVQQTRSLFGCRPNPWPYPDGSS